VRAAAQLLRWHQREIVMQALLRHGLRRLILKEATQQTESKQKSKIKEGESRMRRMDKENTNDELNSIE